jgi:two-component system sensor histidine kinase BaeS
MFHLNIRGRLLLSHILPVLVLVPLVGLALSYLLEFQVIVPTLADEMIDQGRMVARLVQDNPQVWINYTQAQDLVNSINFQQPTHVSLISNKSILLATNRTDDQGLVGTIIPKLSPYTVNPGGGEWTISNRTQLGSPTLEVAVPVLDPDGTILGQVWVYRRITDIEQSLANFRLLILAVLLVGLLLSGSIAVFLSESFSRPLKKLATAIADAPLLGEAAALPEEGEIEFKSLARAYNRLQKRRMELEQNRQQMLANVIHEIGRPLGGMRTAIHALKGGATSDPDLSEDLLDGMTEHIERMNRLLEDMSLTYRKLGPQEIELRQVNLDEWLSRLLPLWAESARQQGYEWRCLSEAPLPTIFTDPQRLSQVISNLVDNAFKFTPPGGKVSLSIRVNQEDVLMTVSDNGPGIPVEDQPRLFTPFYRSVRPSWKAPGLGLGLSISRSIVESLGGSISFNSILGHGSSFTIRLPLTASEVMQMEQ